MAINARELADLDATATAALVRRGELSATEAVEAAIDRVEQVNASLNAVVLEMFDSAREAARAPLGDGPFAGVPFLMKDFLAEVAGVPLTEGTAYLADYVPHEDSALVQRFRRAGLVFIGKTNTPEFAVGATTEPRLFGPTRNPWNPERTPGGSSGGAGAAVAARIVPMAHGNDAGGSIRIPASCCGLVGLKPSRGRVTLGPHYGELFSGMVSELALTRTVRDTAVLLDAVSAPGNGEPYLAPAPERPFAEEVGREGRPLRIGFTLTTPLGDPVHPECATAVRATAEALASLGHHVEEAAPRYDAETMWQRFTTILSAGNAWAMADWARRTGKPLSEQHFEPFVWAFAERGRRLGAADYLLALQDLQRAVRDLGAFFDDHDLWLTPTLGEPPVALGTLVHTGGDPFELRRRTARFSPFTWVSNASGQPAISVPTHWTPDDLPVGVHLVGRMGAEGTLLRVASQLEAVQPWSSHRPGICAG
ncbi:MAG: amidase [Ectothiorhodospiraceae bacterium]|nr:amidase [Chromatiales bacterium]MCP5157035.1 amidase [Ectothiorhodospiraceae bacterium]